MKSTFKIQVINNLGEKVNLEFIGDKQGLEKFIQEENYFVLSIKEKTPSLKKGTFNTTDLIALIEELSYLVASGISLDKSLNIISKNSTKLIQKEFLEEILILIKEGNQLSDAMEESAKKYHINIDNLTFLLIKTNESVGKIEVGLKEATTHLLFNQKISKNIKQAMAYPIFLIIMSISMVFFVFVFIVPKFSKIFTPDEFAQLPPLSKFVLEVGNYINANIDTIFIVIGIISVLFVFYKKIIVFYLKQLLMLLPMFKSMQVNLQLSYLFSSLHLMLEGGVDLKRALTRSSQIITYLPLKNLIENSIDGLKKGVSLSESFSNSTLIPSNAISLIDAGENSATLNKIFHSLTERFLNMFQDDVKKYISILEPVVIVLMGGVIAVIVISIMLAVMSITDVV